MARDWKVNIENIEAPLLQITNPFSIRDSFKS